MTTMLLLSIAQLYRKQHPETGQLFGRVIPNDSHLLRPRSWVPVWQQPSLYNRPVHLVGRAKSCTQLFLRVKWVHLSPFLGKLPVRQRPVCRLNPSTSPIHRKKVSKGVKSSSASCSALRLSQGRRRL
jgi:hypothetical protein